MVIINHSAELITSYHMRDDVVRGMYTPWGEIAFTNTISGVMCIADTFIRCLLVNSSGGTTVSKDYEKFSINFCVIIFGHYIIFGHAELYGLFGFKFAVTHLNSIYIYYWFVVFCYVILYTICVYCNLMCIYMY